MGCGPRAVPTTPFDGVRAENWLADDWATVDELCLLCAVLADWR
jgi:hypothetical protein